jgi:hypothetical protein
MLYNLVVRNHFLKNRKLRIEGPEINPAYINHQLIANKGTKNILWRRDSHFNKWCWENWISACRRLKLHPPLSPI